MTRQDTSHTTRAKSAARGWPRARAPRQRPAVWVAYESQEQEALFQWAALHLKQHPELACLRGGAEGGLRNPKTARALKRMGVKAGWPDVHLAVPRQGYAALFIELKRTEGGRVSPLQQKVHADLRQWGNLVLVCDDGWEAARDALVDYLTTEGREGRG